MVVHEARQPGEPGRGAADLAAAPVVNANQAARRCGMNLAGEGFDLRQGSRRRIASAHEHDHVGLADGLARPCRCFAAAEIDHQRCGMFELVEPVGDFGRIQRAPGKHGVEAGGIDDLGTGRGQPIAHAAIKRLRQRLESALDQRHRSCLRRRAQRGEARGLPGEALRQRREQRLDDGRGVLGELLVGGARQHQHAGVADRNHIGGARDIGEEADFAHQFAGAEFGDRFGIAGLAHRERAMQHHEQGVRRARLAPPAFPRARDPGGPWRQRPSAAVRN